MSRHTRDRVLIKMTYDMQAMDPGPRRPQRMHVSREHNVMESLGHRISGCEGIAMQVQVSCTTHAQPCRQGRPGLGPPRFTRSGGAPLSRIFRRRPCTPEP